MRSNSFFGLTFIGYARSRIFESQGFLSTEKCEELYDQYRVISPVAACVSSSLCYPFSCFEAHCIVRYHKLYKHLKQNTN